MGGWSKGRKSVIGALYAFHVLILVIWFGLFFVPTSVWPAKVIFHFWFIAILYVLQLMMGFILWPWAKKYKAACFFTVFMQSLRGYKINDSRNYNHGFIREFAKDIGLKLNPWFVEVLLICTLIIVSYQFFTM